jgi:proline iminopeptidase
MENPDPAVREQAARDWCAWEDAVIAHETLGNPGQYSAKPHAAKLTFVRICTHYFAHAAWLQDGQLLRDAHHLKDIPGVLIHGRLDLSGPLLTAWELAQAWPEAELMIIEDSGHTGSPAMQNAVLDAIAKFDPALPCSKETRSITSRLGPVQAPCLSALAAVVLRNFTLRRPPTIRCRRARLRGRRRWR